MGVIDGIENALKLWEKADINRATAVFGVHSDGGSVDDHLCVGVVAYCRFVVDLITLWVTGNRQNFVGSKVISHGICGS